MYILVGALHSWAHCILKHLKRGTIRITSQWRILTYSNSARSSSTNSDKSYWQMYPWYCVMKMKNGTWPLGYSSSKDQQQQQQTQFLFNYKRNLGQTLKKWSFYKTKPMTMPQNLQGHKNTESERNCLLQKKLKWHAY